MIQASGKDVDAAEQAAIVQARKCPKAFAAYVMRDEETNSDITLNPIHCEWHDLISAHPRVLIWSHVEAGKTVQISIARVLWELGRNPNKRFVIISGSSGLAVRIVMTIAKYIIESDGLHRVFPNLVPAKNGSWTQSALTVERDSYAKDPSIQVCGVMGNILGTRIDFLILDDILNYDNTRTQFQRDETDKWLQSTVYGRLTRGAQVVCIGNAWHHDDQFHRFARLPGWVSAVYPLLDAAGNSYWPQRWPPERVEQARQNLDPVEFARQMQCIARSEEESRFKKAWIDNCLALGDNRTLAHSISSVPPGYATLSGVDLSMGGKGSDLTCIFTLLLHPNEDREVLCIESGRWSGPDIIARIIDTHNRYHSIMMVENNGAQEYLLQFSSKVSSVPIRPFHTGVNKHSQEFGVESLATEMALKKWIIPSRAGKPANPEIQAWVQEMLFYKPGAHTGDRLMASWFARELSRNFRPKRVQMGRLDLITR